MSIGAPVLSLVLLAMQGSTTNVGHIAGQVTDASSGRPIAGARVMLMPVVDLPNGATIGKPPLQSTTDAGGAFVFDGVQAGQYAINAEKTGFASYPDVLSDGLPERLTVDGKTEIPPLRIALNRGAILTGKILNAAGEPQADLDVSALRRTDKVGLPDFVPNGHAQTNDLGDFRVAGLAAGDHIVLASIQSHGPFDPVPTGSATAVAPTYFPSTVDQSAARVISLAPGQEATGLDFAIKTVAAFRVSGVAVDSAGRPSPGAVVMLMSDWRTSGSYAPMMSIAGDDGAFVIGNVIAGRYTITADRNAGGGGGFATFTSETDADGSKGGTAIIAVIGATGAQGNGLVRAILADNSGQFAARAITRHPNADKARALTAAGAEVVAANVDDEESLKRAFTGAYGAFCVTFFWDHFSAEKEVEEAGKMARAAKAAGVKHVVWSTLDDTRTFMKLDDPRMPTLHGKYKVPHFDGKGEADQKFRDAGVPTTFLLTVFYWENMIYFGTGPKKGPDGTYYLTMPMGDAKLPAIGVDDIGKCALGIFKRPDLIGKTVGIAGGHPTGEEMASKLSKALGVTVKYNDVPPEVYRGFGFPGADDMGNMFQFKRDFNDVYVKSRSIELARELNPELQSFDQWLAVHSKAIPLA